MNRRPGRSPYLLCGSNKPLQLARVKSRAFITSHHLSGGSMLAVRATGPTPSRPVIIPRTLTHSPPSPVSSPQFQPMLEVNVTRTSEYPSTKGSSTLDQSKLREPDELHSRSSPPPSPLFSSPHPFCVFPLDLDSTPLPHLSPSPVAPPSYNVSSCPPSSSLSSSEILSNPRTQSATCMAERP